jgi:polar amino acid transport system substrate-binding protein
MSRTTRAPRNPRSATIAWGPRARTGALALAMCLAGGGCSLFGAPASTSLSQVTTRTATGTPAPAASAVPCTDPTLSLRPAGPLPRAGDLPDGSYVQQIYNRGRLIAGIAQDTLMFGYLNPLDNQLEGFDIDLVRQLSQAIFGDDLHVEYRVITPAQSVQVLQNGTVDVVVRTLPMTCSRWQQINFSSEYFEAGQRVMVPKASTAQGIGDLGKKRVCAAAGTTALENIASASSHPVPVGLTDQTDCLVQLELGNVDAISTDDVILDGLAAQDPNVKIVGPRFATLPYGIGIGQAHPDFVRYVNAMLEQVRANGTWTALYERWLSQQLGPAAPPQAKYRD